MIEKTPYSHLTRQHSFAVRMVNPWDIQLADVLMVLFSIACKARRLDRAWNSPHPSVTPLRQPSYFLFFLHNFVGSTTKSRETQWIAPARSTITCCMHFDVRAKWVYQDQELERLAGYLTRPQSPASVDRMQVGLHWTLFTHKYVYGDSFRF